MKSKEIIPVVIAVFIVNAAGILLKIFELPAFFTLLGFRFHLSLVIPFLFISGRLDLEMIRKEFVSADYRKNYPYPVSLILLPFLITLVLYLVNYVDIGDPEYFYEFGLSSLFDLPIYLVWNAPQLILFYFFILYLKEKIKLNNYMVFLVFVFLFLFEFMSSVINETDYLSIICLPIIALINLVIINKFRNIYWFVCFNFLLLWIPLLLFGSASETLVKSLFASTYNTWEGFLEVNKVLTGYMVPGFLISVSIMLLIFLILRKGKKGGTLLQEQ